MAAVASLPGLFIVKDSQLPSYDIMGLVSSTIKRRTRREVSEGNNGGRGSGSLVRLYQTISWGVHKARRKEKEVFYTEIPKIQIKNEPGNEWRGNIEVFARAIRRAPHLMSCFITKLQRTCLPSQLLSLI